MGASSGIAQQRAETTPAELTFFATIAKPAADNKADDFWSTIDDDRKNLRLALWPQTGFRFVAGKRLTVGHDEAQGAVAGENEAPSAPAFGDIVEQDGFAGIGCCDRCGNGESLPQIHLAVGREPHVANDKLRQDRHGHTDTSGIQRQQALAFIHHKVIELRPQTFDKIRIDPVNAGHRLLGFADIQIPIALEQIRIAHADEGVIIVEKNFRL